MPGFRSSSENMCDKETQKWAGRHRQELEQETIKGTRIGE